MTRFYLDTEFIEDGKTIELISIGLLSDVTTGFYVCCSDTYLERANDWVKENVLPHLPSRDQANRWATRAQIRDMLWTWVQAHPKPWEFWAYFADYDWVVLCQLFGRMVDLPDGMPQYCNDLKQEMHRLGVTKGLLPEQRGPEHDALADAHWVKVAHQALIEYELKRYKPTKPPGPRRTW